MASILSVGMMFRYTFAMPEIDEMIHKAVNSLLTKFRTPDIQVEGKTSVGCEQMGDLMLEALENMQPIAKPASG